MMENQIYIDNHITMLAYYSIPKPHRHLALHLIFATRGMLECQIEGERVAAPAIMIAADVEHTVEVSSGETIVFLFDAASIPGENICRRYLCGQKYCILQEDCAEELRNLYTEAKGDLGAFDKMVCRHLNLREPADEVMDSRICKILEDLRGRDTLPEDAFAYVCKKTGLSESRFSHLFKKSTGMSFRRYLVLLKLQIAYNGFFSGKSITDIALDAGFDSPSHFANTLQRNFGISASDFQNSMNR